MNFLRRTNPPWEAKLLVASSYSTRRAAYRDVYQVDVEPLSRRAFESIKVVGARYATGRTTVRLTLYPWAGLPLVLDEIDVGKRSEHAAVDAYLRLLDRPARLDALEAELLEALEAREAVGRLETLAKMGGV